MIKLLITALLLSASTVFAGPWTAREVNLIVPFLPGGASDLIARKTSMILSNRFPDNIFVVKYMPGASNMVAINNVLSDRDINNTFIVSNDDMITGPMSQGKDSYNEFVVTNIIGQSPYMLATSNRNNVSDFYNIIKNRGSLMFGSNGIGAGPALWLSSLSGSVTKWENIPYKGAPAIITDVMSGNVNYAVMSSFNMDEYARDNRVIPLMISSATRLKQYPEVPTFQELGFRGHPDGIYYAVYAKKGASQAIVEEVNRAIRDAQKSGAYQDFEQKTLIVTALDLKKSNQYFQNAIKQKQLFYKNLRQE